MLDRNKAKESKMNGKRKHPDKKNKNEEKREKETKRPWIAQLPTTLRNRLGQVAAGRIVVARRVDGQNIVVDTAAIAAVAGGIQNLPVAVVKASRVRHHIE